MKARDDYFTNRTLRAWGREARDSLAALRKGILLPDDYLIPVTVMLPISCMPPWWRKEEIEEAIQEAAWKELGRLVHRPPTPGQLLGRADTPAKARSNAGRSLLAARGGKATAAKMRALGFPNLAKAREALRPRAFESADSIVVQSSKIV